MKNKGCLPIPFLILILAGVVSLFSLIATSTSRAGMVRDHSPQVQMMEQQRMAAVYFRILSWLSDVTPRPAEHAKSNPQPAGARQGVASPDPPAHHSSIELCTFPSAQNSATVNHRTRHLN